MGNLIAFLNAFLSYLLLFALIVVLVIAAVFLGIRLRRRKDAKEALLAASKPEENTGGAQAEKTE